MAMFELTPSSEMTLFFSIAFQLLIVVFNI